MGAYEDKMRERFASFDVDRDGVITQNDIEEMARRILAEFGLETASPDGRDLLQAALGYWLGLADLADQDRDGTISAEEFVEAADQRLRNNPEGFTRVIEPWARAVVRAADTNGDGQVSLAEWERMLVAMGASPDRAHSKARDIDRNGDGIVSVRELLDSAVEFYSSEVPSEDFAVRG